MKDKPRRIKIKGDKSVNKMLSSRGVPGYDIMPDHYSLDVVPYLLKMETRVPTTSDKLISARKQADMLERVLENPLKGSYTLGISSYPSDQRAKYVAQYIMRMAMKSYTTNRKRFGASSLPLWHSVYGGYRDSLRDGNSQERPCMLLIANLHDEGSQYKMEKVRDLLEMHSSIPRIVINGGSPTCDIFTFRLNYPMNYGIYIGPDNLVRKDI